MMSGRRLQGKVALITGAARGIGAAMARLFAEHGANVILGDVLEKQGSVTADEIDSSHERARFVKLDVTLERDWREAVQMVLRLFGELNILVNNAGVYSTSTVANTRVREWDQIIRVNMLGAILGVKHVVAAMRKADGGSIVNVASTTALVGSNRGGVYGGSKAALLSVTKHAAIQHAPDRIRVNVLVPGPVETDMIAQNIKTHEGRKASIARVPVGRIGTVEELAYGGLFLASNESSYMTGAELVIDGGLTAQ